MHELFHPLLVELKEIQNNGGIVVNRNGRKYAFMPFITHCCCDLPAKVKVQGTMGHAGHYACGYCFHKGSSVKTTPKGRPYVRYIKTKRTELRTHDSMLDIYKQLKSEPIKGVRRISCMIAAKDFDLINGFTIDYMHCVLLGVTKKLCTLWFDSSNHKPPYYIKNQNSRHSTGFCKQ